MIEYYHKLMHYPLSVIIISIYLLIGFIVTPILLYLARLREKKINPNAPALDFVTVATTFAFYPIAILLFFGIAVSFLFNKNR